MCGVNRKSDKLSDYDFLQQRLRWSSRARKRDGVMVHQMENSDLQRLLRDHLSEDSARSPAEEYASLRTLPKIKQDEMLRRLRVIDTYLREENAAGKGDVDRAAEELGLHRRSFYRLLDKLRKEGPVRGLTPNYRIARTRSSAADGLGDVVERALIDVLDAEPTARTGDLLAAVRSACADIGIAAPADAAVRRRIDALRRSPSLGAKSAVRGKAGLARAILVDQTAISVPVRRASGSYELAVVTFIVDVDTRVIFGAGIKDVDAAASGLRNAVCDADRRLEVLSTGSLRQSDLIEEIHWVVPDGMEHLAESWARAMNETGLAGAFSAVGERRHGQRLRRLIGAQLGSIRLLPRSTAHPQIEWSSEMPEPISPGPLAELLERAVDEWNYSIVQTRQRAKFESDGPARDAQLRRWRAPIKPDLRGLPDRFQMVLSAAG